MIINDRRALAYIQHVTNIRPIEGADNIEQCNVLGWNLICKKGEFHEGDPCVYIEIDSKVPEREEFEFLRAKGFKVKTMKLGKFNCISQGLAMPQSAFKELAGLSEGTDVTDILGIKYSVQEDNARKGNGDPNAKYKSMAARHQKIFKKKWARWMMRRSWGRKIMFFFFGKKKDNPRGFPTFVSKTDEERVENQPWRIGDGKTYLATEKLDGTSCTYALERKGRNKFEFYVCSRNVRQQDEKQECYHDHNIYWDLAFKYNIEQHLKDFLNQFPQLKWVCIQGEGVGSVQGNPLKLTEDDLYVFNFKESQTGRWSSMAGAGQVREWGMKWVPILGEVQMPDTMEELKVLATGKSKVNPNVMREGIVYRSLDGSDSFKNVSREYLLKHNG
ncbi:MAG: RNA ligase family protein [Anaerobutyricum hallii]|uniref:RNA ligase family protein n=1 Tax=Anaerobutyricum hallii TaxID=39488 RepID=UPI002A8417EA|nr:RNA ligase family protein [Anaerobutyricum hallii]MDY4578000.1 RNA ligase family protein [Anaerobutyricum hallii]